MSRIGKQPVEIPAAVTLTRSGQTVKVKGPKGELEFTLPESIRGEIKNNGFSVTPYDENDRTAKVMWGMCRTMVLNMIIGVTEGFSKELELRGVGYRARMHGNTLSMQLGYSHDVNYHAPDGIMIEVPKATHIRVSGIDKQKVGQVAAEIRSFRKPEPYKGKGVRYVGEYVRSKEGKKK
ncbi:MAG: 50S ribosomal protein L6 [Hyphomonadaceae bacterium]|nr:50S ribosomal protein L6 [Hyphomonadaceae bacterium]MBC6411937.1 50S ribosomal protein L6 [Hyphomonadaceae bacterium]